jgi:phosphatidyl-myo-inositol dimannoside synthase
LNLLVVGTGAPGGVGRYERLLAAALGRVAREREWRIEWLSKRPPPSYLDADRGAAARDRGTVAFALAAVGRQLSRRPDVVVYTHVNLAQVALAAQALRPRSPFVVCAHGIEVWETLGGAKRAALRRADSVVATAAYNKERLIDAQGVEPSRIARIPLALEPQWLATAPAPSRPPTARLLSVARLAAEEGYKGIDRTIEALPEVLRAFPDVVYRIVGEGDDTPRLRALAAEHGVEHAVDFVGRRTHAELLEDYRWSDVFVLPSSGEGFGLVFLEAMAFGKPIVAKPRGGATDVVTHGETGLLVEDDGLAAALLQLLGDREAAVAMGAAGRRRVEREFGFALYAQRWRDLLGPLADE